MTLYDIFSILRKDFESADNAPETQDSTDRGGFHD